MAPRFHDGIGPGERAAVIRDDESVLTPGQMRALGQMPTSPPSVKVSVINNAGADVSVRDAGPDGNGGLNLEIVVDRMTAKNMARPGTQTNNTLASRGVRTPWVGRG
jgi:hypothetical protein